MQDLRFRCFKDFCEIGKEFCDPNARLCFRCSTFKNRCFTKTQIDNCTAYCQGLYSTTTFSWSTSGLPNTETEVSHTDTLEWLIPLIVILFVLAALGCFFIPTLKICLVDLSSYVLETFRWIWEAAKHYIKLQCIKRNGILQDEENAAGTTDTDFYHVRKPILEVGKEDAIYRPNNVVPATENGEGNADLQPSHQEELSMARFLPRKGCDSSDSTQGLLQESSRSS